jgi:DNA-binding response OmpR family regulator
MNTGSKQSIVVVDDDAGMRSVLGRLLSTAGYSVHGACDIRDASERILDTSPVAVLLDLGLPSGDGLEFTRFLRASGESMAIIIVTARSRADQKIAGFAAGADEYITKPFDISELLARTHAVIRRTSHSRPLAIQIDDLVVDPVSRRATRANRKIHLSPTEVNVLYFLALHAGTTVSIDALAKEVWGQQCRMTSGTYRAFIRLLRRKIDKPGEASLIHTLRGEGYMLSGPPGPK